ncbi:4'-phosphopantetheinyl transferase superfamily protein [Flavobacterium sp. Arc3]|uniref:4'-phosphopantetheinyl transferase family protein n=1 Tax=Flavobacterium sp. Arc3 TaxID=3046686 RepID=UPI00352EA1C2
MIGNDVVDLALARIESNWKRQGYLDKIFTQKEQLLISTAENSDIMVWNLWSRKEAAYKIYNRATGIRGYFPLKLECTYENRNIGSVLCNGYTYYTKTEIIQDKIHTIAVTDKMDLNFVLELGPTVKIIKKKGVPFLVEGKKNSLNLVSLSHHGRYSTMVRLKQ